MFDYNHGLKTNVSSFLKYSQLIIIFIRTGLTYDSIMLNYKCMWDSLYPENPDRILKSYERCKFYNLIDKCIEIKVKNL